MSIRVGLIGVGGIGSVHMQHIYANEDATLVAVCDINETAANEAAKQYETNAYTDYKVMFDAHELDALFICVPPFAHQDIEEEACQRGIHLFVEKPIALDMDTAHQKATVIEQSGVLNAAGYCLRYLDTVERAIDYLADKKIAMANGYYLSGFVPTPWFRDQSKSGGQLVEQATHTMDLVRYILGDVKTVYANMALRVLDDIPDMSIPDVTSVQLSMNSGAIAQVQATLTQPDMRSGVEIMGRDFRLDVRMDSITITENGKTRTEKSNVNFYKAQDDAFIKAVLTGDKELIRCSYAEALKTLQVTVAANESAERGLPVSL